MSSNNPEDILLVKKITLPPLDLAISLIEEMLENDFIECRSDEDCDHCYYSQRLEEIKGAK